MVDRKTLVKGLRGLGRCEIVFCSESAIHTDKVLARARVLEVESGDAAGVFEFEECGG